jgi:micrococcal nuclease
MMWLGRGKRPRARVAAQWLAHAVAALMLGFAGVASGTIAALEAGEPLTGRVVRVIDGDTIAVRIDKKVLTVRYIGINTREAKMPADSMIAGPTEAAEFNRALVLGQTVRLEMDQQEKDPQGRTLAYVYVGDLMVNAEMVANGYAAVAITPPNAMHQDMLQQLQRQARLLKVGRWRDSPYVSSREPTRKPGTAAQAAAAGSGGGRPLPDAATVRLRGPAGGRAARCMDMSDLAPGEGRAAARLERARVPPALAPRATPRPSPTAATPAPRKPARTAGAARSADPRAQPPGGR